MKAKSLNAAFAALSVVMGLSTTAHARVANSTVNPMIVAGDLNGIPPDSPGNRVDPNVASSPFSGVVSLNIRYEGQSYICSGTLVSRRDVVTAGHCVDTDGNGTVIDLTKPGNDVRAVFNAGPGAGSAIVTASAVSMNPNYAGFGNCPAGVAGFCVNDDVAVVHLGEDAPSTARSYRTFTGNLEGQLITMVGYGRSGDGINGYTVDADFRIKRSGQNYVDLFDLDDEQDFAGGAREVWYADFDGNGNDSFCDLLAVCSPRLPNDREATIGGGDSGGPSFLFDGHEYFLVGNNTFGGSFAGQIPGSFGTYFGGMTFSAYTDYLRSATGGAIQMVVPEPQTYALMLLGLGVVGAMARRRKLS